MEQHSARMQTRRAFLRVWLAVPATFVLAACAGQSAGTATPGAGPASTPTSAPAPSAAPAPTGTTVAQASPTQGASPPPSPSAATLPASPSPQATPTRVASAVPSPTQATQVAVLTPTPSCDDGDEPTPAQTEGPYYTPNTPERASLLEAGMGGTKLILTGAVLATDCRPVARALIDFWQADDKGAYDNTGFRLRGHQFTDAQGRYRLETVVPGLYTGRTRHIHVKVQAPNRPILTTQLYFPGEARNSADSIFRPELLLTMQSAADGQAATFDFVLDLG